MKYFEVIVPEFTPERFAKWLYREVNALVPPMRPVVDKGKIQLLLENLIFNLTEPEKPEWEAYCLQIDARPFVAVKGLEMFGYPMHSIQGWGELISSVVVIEMRDDGGQVHIVGECHDYMDDYVRFLLTRLKHVYPEARAIPPFASQTESYLMWRDENSLHKQPNKVSILFLAADPTDAARLRLGEEFREIKEILKLAKLRDRFRLELPQLSVRPNDISQALLDAEPQIVHFSGHGTDSGALRFENQIGETHLVCPDVLSALFEQFASRVNCVLLNACYSEVQAKAIAEHIQYVVGMNQAVGDKAAIAFTIGFYQALGAGRTIEEAYNLGCVQIRLQNIPEYLTPVLLKDNRNKPLSSI